MIRTLKTLCTVAVCFVGAGTASAQIAIYQHCNFDGYGIEIGTGYWNMGELIDNGMINDDISAVAVDPGYQVTLFADANWSGQALTLSGDVACLVDYDFNDVMSSIVVAPY